MPLCFTFLWRCPITDKKMKAHRQGSNANNKIYLGQYGSLLVIIGNCFFLSLINSLFAR